MKLDFIIIWTAKAGTTWLTDMLGQHPDVFVPKQKELHYFNEMYSSDLNMPNINQKRGIKRYEKFFKDAKGNQIKWEATPAYLWDKKAAENIYKFDPNMKLIAIFRNPIEKIYSFYLYSVQRWITSSQTISEEIKKSPFLVEQALYYEQIKKYYEIFPKENIKIMFFDDLKKDNKEFLKKIEKFIWVESFIPENIDKRSNTTWVPKYLFIKKTLYKLKNFFIKHNFTFPLDLSRKIGLSTIITKIEKAKKKTALKKITIEEKKMIYNLIKEDIEKLEKFLDKNLSHRKI